MTALRALLRKELLSLLSAPTAYLTLTFVAVITALIFFDHRVSTNRSCSSTRRANMGGFDSDTIPDYVNLWTRCSSR